MTGKWLAIIGTWILADAIFSLYTYLGKEGWKENSIRVVRAMLGIILVVWG